MKAPTTLVIPIVVAMISLAHLSKASEVDDILKEIGGGSKSSGNSESSSSRDNTSLKKKATTSDSGVSVASPESASTPRPKRKKPKTSSEDSGTASIQEPQGTQLLVQQNPLTLFQPDEKIPNNVQGDIGFYGDFKIDMISGEGELWLQSAGARSPFTRKFMIANNDLPRGRVINPSRELTIRISKKDPLVVSSRGLGFYQVNVSQNTWNILMQAVRACFQ